MDISNQRYKKFQMLRLILIFVLIMFSLGLNLKTERYHGHHGHWGHHGHHGHHGHWGHPPMVWGW